MSFGWLFSFEGACCALFSVAALFYIFYLPGSLYLGPAKTRVAYLRERKDALQFTIFGVLVDVGSVDTSSMAQFADKITSVKKLTAESSRDIFLAV